MMHVPVVSGLYGERQLPQMPGPMQLEQKISEQIGWNVVLSVEGE